MFAIVLEQLQIYDVKTYKSETAQQKEQVSILTENSSLLHVGLIYNASIAVHPYNN